MAGRTVAGIVVAAVVALALPAGADAGASRARALDIAGTIELITAAPGDEQADWHSSDPSVSADGRYVAFASGASNLVEGDGDDWDVFVHDRVTGTTTLVSVDSGGGPTDGESSQPSISADGQRVAFASDATDLVPGDTNGVRDVFVRDLTSGATTLVSVDATGGPADGPSTMPDLSADGEHVAFASTATDLVTGDGNGVQDVFVRDLGSAETVMASVNHLGQPSAFANAEHPKLSADGRFVAFSSGAGDLDPPDPNFVSDVFVRDLDAGSTTLVSRDAGGGSADGGSFVVDISGDGSLVLFDSQATDLIEEGGGGMQVYLRDVPAESTSLVSVDTVGARADDWTRGEAFSDDGRYVLMTTESTNLAVCSPASDDLVLRDSETGSVTPVAVGLDGRPASASQGSMTPDGGTVAFRSTSAALVPGHTGVLGDIFAVDLTHPYGPLFSDVLDTHLFRCDIGWLVENQIAEGFEDGTYRPTTPVSRQAMAAFLHRLAGSPVLDAVPPTSAFPDVPFDHPFSESIEWLAAEQITDGFPDGTFRPTTPVSRQSMAVYLHRLAGTPTVDLPTTPTFPDVPLDHPFAEAIEWAHQQGIVDGFEDETFRPTTAVSRQSMAAFLRRHGLPG